MPAAVRRWVGAKPLRDRAYDVAMWLMGPLERTVVRSSLVGTTPFLPVAEFPWTRALEANWRTIRAELDEVLVYRDDLPAFHEITADVSDISDENWRIFAFYGYGFRSDANCARCPQTARLLEQVPGLTTAFFSILAPGKRIPPHRGPWRGVLRYHLGLLIPEPEKCGIKVGGEVAHWYEGESMVFDDAYEHSAWNDTSRTRVVLFIDFLRPARFPGSWLNRAVVGAVSISPFVSDAKRKHKAWERTFGSKHPGNAATR
jgi:aspartyl/asparaginyl beta-hydroxylase (cupin superfamily)